MSHFVNGLKSVFKGVFSYRRCKDVLSGLLWAFDFDE